MADLTIFDSYSADYCVCRRGRIVWQSDSYRIHEVALDAGEDEQGEEEHGEHEEGAVEQPSPGKGAATKTAVFESLENGGEGVEQQ